MSTIPHKSQNSPISLALLLAFTLIAFRINALPQQQPTNQKAESSTTAPAPIQAATTQVPTVNDTITSKAANADALETQIISSNSNAKAETRNSQSTSNMPWIVALLIGVATVCINFYIAKINQDTSIRNISRQLDTSKETIAQQITSAKEIALQQIENSQKISNLQFRANINATNRQSWINELRHCTSEFLAQCAIINAKLTDKPDVSFEELVPSFEKMVYNKNKISMLLNTEKSEQLALRDAVFKMTAFAGKKANNSQDEEAVGPATRFADLEKGVVSAARELFKIHWNKIKNLSTT